MGIFPSIPFSLPTTTYRIRVQRTFAVQINYSSTRSSIQEAVESGNPAEYPIRSTGGNLEQIHLTGQGHYPRGWTVGRPLIDQLFRY